ncbi:MAG: CARDB domain-containing protein, partial [Cyclonatronaceae bacterium]
TNDEELIRINDTEIGWLKREGILQPGESYTVSTRVKLPDDAIGDYILFVYTDLDRSGGKRFYRGRVFELNQEFNNWQGEAISIVLTPPPDLVATQIDVQTSALSGERITVGWEVENQGPGAARSRDWMDAVFLSATPELDVSDAYSLGVQQYTASSPFNPDATYARQMVVTLPDGIEGTWYLYVYTDRFANVFEHTFNENNITRSQPIAIERSLYPDLFAGDPDVPAVATAGERITITWRVENIGEKATEGTRTDYLFVSNSPEWDFDEAVLLDKVEQSRPLGINESQSSSHLVRLPNDLMGDTYFHVIINADSTLFEYPDEANNVGSSQRVDVSEYPPPDLVIEQLTIPETAASGQPASFGWAVRNAGGGATLSPEWNEMIYLSPDNITPFDPGEVIPVRRIQRRGVLASGEVYERTLETAIPHGVSGDYYVIVTTENDSLTGDVNVTNNIIVSETTLAIALSPPADLEVGQLEAPAAVNAGEVSLIRWTVENTGTGITPAGKWFDALYLTVQDEIDKNAILIGTVEHEGSVGPGSSYEHELEVEFPAYISGSYNLIVGTDSRNDIYEHEGEDNNLGTHPVSVTIPSPTDLAITNVMVDEQAVPGELITVSWTLVNQGSNPAKARIREAVYILPDTAYDPSAPVLGIIDRDIDLDPGADMVMSADLNVGIIFQADDQGNIIAPLPPIVGGDYRIAVRTNLRKTVRETNLQNNTGISAGSVSVAVPELISGEPVSVFIGETEKNLYRFDIPAGADVVFRLESETEMPGSAALYLSREKAPTRSDFDFSAAEPFMFNQEIRLPGAEGGTWYLMMYVESAGDAVPLTVSAHILDYMIGEITPNYGGNTGVVTVYVSGAKFQEGSTLYLEDAGGGRLEAQGTYVINSTELAARLQLYDEEVGTRNVVVVSPTGEETMLSNGFHVVEGVGARPYTRITYPNAVRSYEPVTVEITVGNDGTENATDYFLLLGARRTVFTSGRLNHFYERYPQHPSVPPVTIPMSVALDDSLTIVMPLWLYEIPPGAELTFSIQVMHEVLEGVISHGAYLVPMPESGFTRTGSPDELDSSVGFRILAESMSAAYAELASSAGSEIMNDPVNGLKDLLGGFGSYGMPAFGFAGGIVGGVAGYLIVGGLLFNPATALLATGVALGVMVGGTIGAMIDARNARDDITRSGRNLIKANLDFGTSDETHVKRSFDPNDIIGPEGHGEEKWVGIQEPLQYTIRFENDPELATAPAQIVTIRQDLDPHADVRTFRLGQYGFGPFTFNPPANSSYHSERLNVVDSLGVMVDITAGIDVITRQAFWVFRSIDPA